ncbi:MAG: hypothetical protein ABH803_00360 [Candidatus Micrarchaeota archaeon]
MFVKDRKKTALPIQKTLTKYGCGIQARIGLHESTKTCSNAALIILQLSGSNKENALLLRELNKIKSVKAKLVDASKF